MKELLLLRCHNAKRRGSVAASPPPPTPPRAASQSPSRGRPPPRRRRRAQLGGGGAEGGGRDAAGEGGAARRRRPPPPPPRPPKGKRGASKPTAAPLSLAVQLSGGGTAQLELPPVVTEATLRDALAEIETRRAARRLSPTRPSRSSSRCVVAPRQASREHSRLALPRGPRAGPGRRRPAGWEEEGRRVESEMRRVEEERRFVKELEGIGSAMAPAAEPPAAAARGVAACGGGQAQPPRHVARGGGGARAG